MQNNSWLPLLASIGVGAATGAATYYSMKNSKTKTEKTMKKETGQPIPTTNFF